MSFETRNGKIYVEGSETTNPELIGLAVLDALEANSIEIITKCQLEEDVKI